MILFGKVSLQNLDVQTMFAVPVIDAEFSICALETYLSQFVHWIVIDKFELVDALSYFQHKVIPWWYNIDTWSLDLTVIFQGEIKIKTMLSKFANFCFFWKQIYFDDIKVMGRTSITLSCRHCFGLVLTDILCDFSEFRHGFLTKKTQYNNYKRFQRSFFYENHVLWFFFTFSRRNRLFSWNF